MTARTMFEKIWRAHEVVPETAETPAVMYVDLHLTHEVTSPQAFAQLRERGLRVRRPGQTLATLDHAVPTDTGQVFGGLPIRLESAAQQIGELERNAREFGFELLGLRDARRGIVHVIGPELGLTQPGMTIVCGDSHTSTHGAFGTLAFGIGTTEVAHVFATQCLLQRKPKTLAITVEGRLGAGVSAKDLVLAIIGRIGVAGGARQAIEYRGGTIRAMAMDERMTICNMSIEAGARAGMIAPDETTFAFLRGRPRAPSGEAFERAVERWRRRRRRCGRCFRSRDRCGCRRGRADDQLRHESRDGDGDRRDDSCGRGRERRPGAALHGTCAGRAARGPRGAGRLHRQLHQRAPAGSSGGGGGVARPPRCERTARARGAGLAAGEAGGGSGGPAPRVSRRGRGVARVGLLHVRRHQRRHRGAGRICREHEQPEFRRAAGARGAHAARESR